jgi:hypothetical protein
MRTLPLFLVAAVVGAGPPEALAKNDVIPFDEAQLFIEFNSTDNDAGIQVFLDAEDWELLRIRSPHGQKILQILATGGLGELGLTELRFESAEPSPFLPDREILALFPEGDYEFEASTLEGDVLVGTATLSHALPPAPSFSPCDGALVDLDNTVIDWETIAGVVGYEVIVENEELGVSMAVVLPASKTSLQVPPGFLEPDTEYKAEVLAIAANGNKTITECLFQTMP